MSTVQDVVSSIMEKVRIGPTRSYRNVCVAQLCLRKECALTAQAYRVATPELLTSGMLEVRETGAVSQLALTSHCPEPVFIPAGFLLRGGGQNRAVAASVIIPARAITQVTVRCVEERRWRPHAGERMSGGEDTAILTASSTVIGSPTMSQHKTWHSVAETIRATDTITDTKDLSAVYAHTTDQRAQYREHLHMGWEHSAVGVWCAIRKRGQTEPMCTLDVFGHPSMLTALYPAVVESVLIDAIAAGWQNSADTIVPHEGSDKYWRTMLSLQQTTLTTTATNDSSTLLTGATADHNHIALLLDQNQLVHFRSRHYDE